MNRLRTALVLVLAAAAWPLLAGLAARPPQRQDAARVPCVAWSGPDSRIAARRFERVRDEQAWLALWGEHAGKDEPGAHPVWRTAPLIDFSRFEVVAVFRGRATNNNGERVEAIDDTPDGRRIRFDSASFQTAGSDERGGAVDTLPYGIWVVDRTDSAVVLEENVQGIIGRPPLWKEQHRFEAPREGARGGR